MAANTTPIFPIKAALSWATISAANTAKDGTGTTVLVYTAGATDGGRVDFLKFMPLGTNIATVVRVFLNNGLTPATAANNNMYAQKTLPATTNSETAQIAEQLIQLDLSLNAGYRLYVTLGTAVAAGFAVTAVAGDYS